MRGSVLSIAAGVMLAIGCGSRSGLRPGERGAGAGGAVAVGGSGSGVGGATSGSGATGSGASGSGGELFRLAECDANEEGPSAPERSFDTLLRLESTVPGTLTNVGHAIAAFSDGRLLITGQFDGTLDWGNGAMHSHGAQDVFVASLMPDSAVIWSRSFGTPSTDRGNGVAFDSQGNAYVVGETGAAGNVIDFGAGPVIVQGSPQMFVVSYDLNGNYRWAKLFGGTGSSRLLRVVVDANDDVYLAGYVTGTTDFGGGVVNAGQSVHGAVLSLGKDGDYRWSTTFPGDYVLGSGLAVAESGNVYFGGWFWRTADFGNGPITTPNDGADAFLVALDAGGDVRWSKTFGDEDIENIVDVCVDPSENVYVVGDVDGSHGYDATEIWAASFDGSGADRFSYTLGGVGIDFAMSCVATESGVVLAGIFEGCIDFGAGGRQPVGYGGFALELDGDGAPLGSLLLDGPGADHIHGVTLSADASTLYVTGTLGTSFEDPSPMYLEEGTADVFVASMRR